MLKKLFQCVTLAIMAVSLVSGLSSCSEGAQNSQGSGEVPSYPVKRLKYQQVTTNKSYPATIEGIQTVELRPRVEGYLEEISVDEGATVQKGETLFKINANEYTQAANQARANIAVAEAQVNTAKMEVEKQRPLVEKGIVSEYMLTSAIYAEQSAEASLQQTQAALESALTNLSYTSVKSPTNGIIGTIPYRIGSLVSSTITEPLTNISDIRQVRAYFAVNEKDYLYLSKNVLAPTIHGNKSDKKEVELILANGALFPIKGSIDAISGIISQSTGSVTVRATFDNPEGILRSGGSATVRLPNRMDSVLVVPQVSTYEIQNKRFIYVVNADNKVEIREIEVMADDQGVNFLVTKGLQPGELVVVDGINSLKPDMEIKPEESAN